MAQFQEVHSLMEQALALMPVPERFAHDPPSHARPEIVAVVEAVHRLDHVLAAESGIFEMRKLMPEGIGDRFGGEKAFSRSLIVKFRAGIRMGHRDLDRLAIEFLR